MTRTATLVLACLALVAAGCGAEPQLNPDGTGTVRVVQAGRTVSGSGLYALAEDWGMFRRYGVEVETVTAKSGSTAMQTLLSGDADLALTGTADVLLANAKLRRIYMPLRMFSGVSTSLVVRRSAVDARGVGPGAPVADRLRALQGLTIATVSASSNTTGILRNALATAGATVRETYLDQNSMVAAFRAGQIDGFMASPPHSNTVVVKGDAYMWLDGPHGDYPGAGADFFHAVLGVDGEFADAHPATVERVVAALLATSERIRSAPGEASRTLHQRFPEVTDGVWEAMWAQVGGSFAAPVPTQADLETAADTVVPAANRELVARLELAPLLGAGFVERARALTAVG
jgi:ABC-type nitrate/sulfonate/bicarbonate transport system substrate-binding protein